MRTIKELIVDNFAGGGGASTGIELAIGRHVDIAINHDPAAIAMHKANHPKTKHYCENVWDVDPTEATKGIPVGLAWFSPDCKHFSKAKGGKPVEKSIRGLAWIVLKWAGKVKPRVIILENVEEFVTWGPVRKGKPVKSRKGETFEKWKSQLEALGYKVEHRELRACDYGAPTIRKRFFLVARCDGRKIVWPEPTHGDPDGLGARCGLLKPWRTAAEIIDWSMPCPSIFERKRPLAENTMRRIARGIQKFVINNPNPFIVQVNHSGSKHHYCNSLESPLPTITSKHGFGLVTPFLTSYHSETTKNEVRGLGVDEPIHTLDTSNRFSLVTSFLTKFYKTGTGQSVREPLHTITTSPGHFGEVRTFLLKYYGADIGQSLKQPLHTITSKDRFGLVTIQGEKYQIADIGMRMLQPRELFNAQGFPEDYIIDHDYKGNKYSKTAQVARCGNAVPPPLARALVKANLPELCNEDLREAI